MRPDVVVVLAPVGEDDAGFAEGVEQLSVEALGAEATVKGLSAACRLAGYRRTWRLYV